MKKWSMSHRSSSCAPTSAMARSSPPDTFGAATPDTPPTARTPVSTTRSSPPGSPAWLCGQRVYCGQSMNPDPTVFPVVLLLPDGERSIQVSRDEHIWDAAFAAGIVLPALCHQGRCLTCAGRLEGEGEVDQSDSVSYYPEDREAGFILLCTGKPRT